MSVIAEPKAPHDAIAIYFKTPVLTQMLESGVSAQAD